MNQVIIVNKEKDLTSRDVINKLNKIFNTKKIGHAGTLDPLATGILVCLVGKYTKLVSEVSLNDKEYIATIKLGIMTDTLDITGNVIKKEVPKLLEQENIKKVLNSFLGEYKQQIPLYSAKHVNGKRLYEYARENKPVKLPENNVLIKEIELLSYENDEIVFRTTVSKGTYIRSLIQSICQSLGVIGTMNSLVRTRQGIFTLDDASTLEEIAKGNFKSLKLKDILDVKEVNLDDTLYNKVINGNRIDLDLNGYVLFKREDEEIALYYFLNRIGSLKILLK